MNIQSEPFVDIATNLGAVLLGLLPELKHAKIGWPDRKWLQVEGNRPSVFFVDVSETGQHYVSQFDTHRTVIKPDGTGQIIQEKLRLKTLVQISLFTSTKGDRDQLGWQMKQHLITRYRLPLLDYSTATPAPTGEYAILRYRGDHKEAAGEANFWKRDLTFEAQSRVLDAITARRVDQISLTGIVDKTLEVQAQASLGAPLTLAGSSTINSQGNTVDSFTITISAEP